MKFSAKTVMKTATFRDLSLARHQGTLAENPLSGYFDVSHTYDHSKENFTTYFLLITASTGLFLALVNMALVALRARRSNVGGDAVLDSPLV
jgi:hypothetical protein